MYFIVGITETCERLAVAATPEQASEYIGTLPGHEDGRYYIDGPIVDVVVLDKKLVEDEKKVLAQALTDYMEGIERADLSNEDKQWCEENVSSIERKVL